jgi:hypothetical protein
MRIFVGINEVANLVFKFAKAFRSLGFETYTVVQQKNLFYPASSYDELLRDRLKRFKGYSGLWAMVQLVRAWIIFLSVFLRALLTCHVFIFVWGGVSFLPRHLDYPLLKALGKKLVVFFAGDDIRSWHAYEQDICSMGLEKEFKPYLENRRSDAAEFFEKLHEAQVTERYADLILTHPEVAQLLTRPYMRLWIPLDLTEFRFHLPDKEVPLVVHAPTSPLFKGTKYILDAVEQLRGEGIRFEFRLIERMPNDRLRTLLAEADIVIDQLFQRAFGTLAVESMASGCVVLTSYDPSFGHFDHDCPAVNVSMSTLTDQLRRTILDRRLRRRLGYAGRRYVEKYHDQNRVAQQILDYLAPAGIKEYDFIPTFLHERFVITRELEEEAKRRREWGTIRPLIRACRTLITWPLSL